MAPEYVALFRMFGYGGLALELIAFVAIVAGGGGGLGFPALVVGALLIGFLTSAPNALFKPRSAPLALSFCIHALFVTVAGAWAGWSQGIEPWIKQRALASARESKAQLRDARVALITFVELKRYAQARELLTANEALRFDKDPAPFDAVLCPPDHTAPDTELLRAMVDRKAPSGGQLLLMAAKCSLPSVKAVVQLGISPTTVHKRRNGLMVATNLDAVKFFAERGVDPDYRGYDGMTALMFHRTAEITRYLTTHGADVRAVDDVGRSVLHFKYQTGFEEHLAAVYAALLDAGADPTLRDKQGRSALFCLAADQQGENAGKRWLADAADVLGQRGVPAHGAIQYRVEHRESIERELRWPNLNLDGANGATLLTAAVKARASVAMRQLLAAGANPSLPDIDGVVPLQLAEQLDRSSSSYLELQEAATRQAQKRAAPR